MLDAVPHAQLGGTLASATAFAFPAQWFENDPLIVKSALFVGVPVASSALGSLPAQFVEPSQGWLLPHDSPGAWAEWLVSLAARSPAVHASDRGVPLFEEFATALFALYNTPAHE